MARQALYIAKSVTSGNEDSDTYTVPNGKKVTVVSFNGEAAFSPNSAVKIVWDFGGGAEAVLWSIKGSDKIDSRITQDFPTMTGDGTKKIAVALDNGEAGSVFLSGHATLEVED